MAVWAGCKLSRWRGRNASGREREYRWLLNYNTETRRYDLVGVFSNYTGKVVQTIRIDSTGTVWNIRSPSSVSDGIEQWSWAQLVFESPNGAVWTGYRNLETNAPGDWSVSTRETWVRRAGTSYIDTRRNRRMIFEPDPNYVAAFASAA